MDLVLGLSMTSTTVRWVLVDGTTGEGATISRGVSDIATVDTLGDEIAAAFGDRLHAIGVTWTSGAQGAASGVLQALTDSGLGAVVAVSELEAAEALAVGVGEMSGYDDIAVCIVEDDATIVALVGAATVSLSRIDRVSADGAAQHSGDVTALLDRNDRRPAAVFVLGSAQDADELASSLDGAIDSLIFSAADADLALARGAAVTSARAKVVQSATTRRPYVTHSGAVAAVLVAAVMTFVVSLSVAVGLRLAPGADPDPEKQQLANAAKPALARAAGEPSIAKAAPKRPPPAAAPPAPPPDAVPPAAQTITAATPPAPEAAPEPEYNPPPAAAPVEPAPAYQAPVAPPAYVPPAPAYVRPRRPTYRRLPPTCRLRPTLYRPYRSSRGYATGSSSAYPSSIGSTNPNIPRVSHAHADGASSRTACSAGSVYVTTASASAGPRLDTTCGTPAWMKTACPAV